MKNIFIKFKNMPDSVKAAFIFMMVSFFDKGMRFLTTPIFTRILTPEDYGIISVYNILLQTIGTIAMLSLSSGAFNVGMQNLKDNRNGFISAMLILSNFATIIVLILFIIFKTQVYSLTNIPKNLFILMFLYFMISPAKSFWASKQRYEYKYKLSGAITVLTAILSVMMSLIFVISATTDKVSVYLWSSGLVEILVALVLYIFLMFKGLRKVKIRYWGFALAINIPLVFHSLSKVILDGSDKLMIAHYTGTGDSGKYSVVSMISTIAAIVWSAINGSMIPYIFKKMEEKKFSDIDKVVKPILVTYAILCCIVILFGPEIIRILAPKEYYDAVYVIPPITTGIFLTALFNFFGNIELYYKKTNLIMWATMWAAILNIILNIIFIPHFTYIAAAYTTLICYIVLVIMHYKNVKKITEDKIFEPKFLLILSIVVILFGLFSNIIYSNPFLRISLSIILLIGFLLKFKSIKNILLSIKNKIN